METKFLRVDEAAESLKVSEWTIRKWIQERRIRSYRFGGAVRLRLTDLLQFAEVTPSTDEILSKIK